MLTITETDSAPEPRPIAEKFMRVLADAAADGVELAGERELHAAFLAAALAGDDERCRQMIADAESRLGAMRAARRLEEQRRQAANEIASARATYERHLSAITRTNGDIADRRAEFAAAEAAGDVEKCRALAIMAENVWRAKLRPASEIEAERRAGLEAAARAFAADQERRAREAHLQDLRARCAHGWNVLADIEQHGTIRIGEDGAILYSGQPLDEDVMQAIEWKAADIRNALSQRWQDRVLIPASEAALTFDSSAKYDGALRFV